MSLRDEMRETRELKNLITDIEEYKASRILRTLHKDGDGNHTCHKDCTLKMNGMSCKRCDSCKACKDGDDTMETAEGGEHMADEVDASRILRH